MKLPAGGVLDHPLLIKDNQAPLKDQTSPPLKGLLPDHLLKPCLLVSMCLCSAGTDLLTAYTRQVEQSHYLPSTVVFLTELTKLAIALVALLLQMSCSPWKLVRLLVKEIPTWEAAKILIPAALYTVQNNLYYFALSNLDPATYIVIVQFKIFTTAIFMRILLNVRISTIQWVALGVLSVGVCLVQLAPQSMLPSSGPGAVHGNVQVGLAAMVIICFISGFSGVYFEKLLKHSPTPFWVRNLQMYFLGSLTSGIALVQDWEILWRGPGFFSGYTSSVVNLVGLSSFTGVFISLVMRHLDNMYKTFASSVSIVLATLGLVMIFHVALSLSYLAGASLVITAIFLYNQRKEAPRSCPANDKIILLENGVS